MIKLVPLHDANFLLYAAQHYDNAQCFDQAEFFDDLNRFKYLKRLFNKYKESAELRERLILNHIVTLYNMFGVEATTRMLFFKLKGFEDCLKPFLEILNLMPDAVFGIGITGETILSDTITSDLTITEALKSI